MSVDFGLSCISITGINLTAMVVLPAHQNPQAYSSRTRSGSRYTRWLLACFCCWVLVVYLLETPSCAFGRPKQESLGALRERTGQATRIRVKDVLGNGLPLSSQEKRLLRNISIASDRRNWKEVQSHYDGYAGRSIQIYTAVMNAALRCRRFEEGALVYRKCRSLCTKLEEPTFNAALKLFARLGQPEEVRKIWNETRKECTLSYRMG